VRTGRRFSTRRDSLFSPPVGTPSVGKVQGRTSSESDDEFSKIFPEQPEYGESKKTLASQFDADTRRKLAFEFSKYLRLLQAGLSKLYALMEIQWISPGVMDDIRAEEDYATLSDTRDVCALVRCAMKVCLRISYDNAGDIEDTNIFRWWVRSLPNSRLLVILFMNNIGCSVI
jgi:hypothetical protein